MAKKSFTESTGNLLCRGHQELTQAEKRGEKNPVGRPPKPQRTTTSQEGLQEGMTRMTFIVSQENQFKLRYISLMEGLSIKTILSQAIGDYINNYEQEKGIITK